MWKFKYFSVNYMYFIYTFISFTQIVNIFRTYIKCIHIMFFFSYFFKSTILVFSFSNTINGGKHFICMHIWMGKSEENRYDYKANAAHRPLVVQLHQRVCFSRNGSSLSVTDSMVSRKS